MAELSTKAGSRASEHQPSTWAERFVRNESEWEAELGISRGWAIAGIALIALSAFAVYHFGPHFRRCLKIESM